METTIYTDSTTYSEKIKELKVQDKAKAMDMICNKISSVSTDEEIGKTFKNVCEWATAWCNS